MGIHQKCLDEALLMSTHNIRFHAEIKISVLFSWKKSLSRAMYILIYWLTLKTQYPLHVLVLQIRENYKTLNYCFYRNGLYGHNRVSLSCNRWNIQHLPWSIKQRFQVVIDNNGGHTGYWLLCKNFQTPVPFEWCFQHVLLRLGLSNLVTLLPDE